MANVILLKNARLASPGLDPELGYIRIEGDRITAAGAGTSPANGATVVDLGGRWVAPGFIDLHNHGGAGAHYGDSDLAAYHTVARFAASHGTTGLLAGLGAAPPDRLARSVAMAAAAMAEQQQAEAAILGIHLEGPFLSQVRRGSMNPAYLRAPDPEEMATLRKAADGALRLVSLAPELPGAEELTRSLAEAGVTVALAHTDATYEQAMAVIHAGATHAIHTFNGMRPLHHREPGVLGAVLTEPTVTCEAITDGYHLHPSIIRLLYQAKGPEGMVLITDAVEAAGMPDGLYDLGNGHAIRVAEGKVELADGSSLAGSTLTMDRAVRNAVKFLGVSVTTAVTMASLTPARVIGLHGRKGRLQAGWDADLVVLSEDLEVAATMVAGRWAWGRP